MVSKNQIKLIQSLQQKKFRRAHGLFIAEGEKVVGELLDSSYRLSHLYVTQDVFSYFEKHMRSLISDTDLKKISALSASNNCLAVFEIPETKPLSDAGLTLALDDVRDPGNLGTIIRLCDWFGIENLVCSKSTADMYNPKVVQATMGSLARVNVHYTNLPEYLKDTTLPVYGAFMDGESVYGSTLSSKAVIVMGNEANGISESVECLVQKRISIPRFGSIKQAESLNVANATAILLSEFCRR